MLLLFKDCANFMLEFILLARQVLVSAEVTLSLPLAVLLRHLLLQKLLICSDLFLFIFVFVIFTWLLCNYFVAHDILLAGLYSYLFVL